MKVFVSIQRDPIVGREEMRVLSYRSEGSAAWTYAGRYYQSEARDAALSIALEHASRMVGRGSVDTGSGAFTVTLEVDEP